jgi:hypothetical protein
LRQVFYVGNFLFLGCKAVIAWHFSGIVDNVQYDNRLPGAIGEFASLVSGC